MHPSKLATASDAKPRLSCIERARERQFKNPSESIFARNAEHGARNWPFTDAHGTIVRAMPLKYRDEMHCSETGVNRADWLAVLAVICELGCISRFPANREICRDSAQFQCRSGPFC